ncbi:MAG: phosphorylase [Fibrobacteria bacterium]|nr:phosphorylase [Fibrobacteria bacterium]
MQTENQVLIPGSLLSLAKEAMDKAQKSGALLSIDTFESFIEDGGVRFVLRTISSLAEKAKSRIKLAENKKNVNSHSPVHNPFLPYEEDMFVSGISNTHLCLLNKFKVIDNHLLIVTREFEHQNTLLNRKDFAALWLCLNEFDGLGFYNGGEIAGASQAHKHLQLIPLGMSEEVSSVPLCVLFPTDGSPGAMLQISSLPFKHCFAYHGIPLSAMAEDAADRLYALYREMLQKTRLNKKSDKEDASHTGPYNLLVTRKWIFLVPRSVECVKTISVNALGFAGGLLAKNKEEIQIISDIGPMTILKKTGISL